jgi:peptide chain release factor 1
MDQVVKRFEMLEAQMAAGPEPDAYVRMASEYSEIQDLVGKIRALRGAERDRYRHARVGRG